MRESDTFNRRGFLRAGGGALAGSALLAAASAAAPEQQDGRVAGSALPVLEQDKNEDWTTADLLVETLITWGATHVFGMVGDGIAGVIEAIRKRQDRIRYIGVRHEEAAAFMASGFAKLTGRLGVCIGTTGPGAVHLLNGLYDAAFDHAPVVVITGVTFHDLGGTHFIQALDTPALMTNVARYNVQVSGPRHAVFVGNIACRVALAEKGVAHLAIAKDVQAMKLSADKASMENHGARTSWAWQPPRSAPDSEQLAVAASLLNGGNRVAILVGQGALGAGTEVEQIAARLGAPVAKAMLGRNVIADDSPFSTAGIGHLGSAPSSWAMHACDTVLIVGSTMPWLDYYPKPGQARGVQIDLDPSRIGLRYPVDMGLVGDARSTLRALLPLLRQHDGAFVAEARSRMRDWNTTLEQIEHSDHLPLRPQRVIRAISDAAADDAIITFDCGANTHFAARHFRFKKQQRLISPGLLDTMAPGLPYAIAAQLVYPARQVIAVVGDGGFAMLMAEMTTAVQHGLPIKVVVLDNRSLAQVTFEQKEAGYGVFGCDLGAIDFVAFAKACGAEGVRCADAAELAIAAALRSSRAMLIHAIVDPAEPTLRPEQVVG